MQFDRSEQGRGDEDRGLAYLARRVRQEAEAAIRASTVEATLVHVALATAYAKRFGEGSAGGESAATRQWVDDNRIW